MFEITSASEFTRHKLMMAALGLFAEKGFASVRVHHIVTAAKARNNGAVYYHFGNKDKLLVDLYSVIQSHFDTIRAPMIKDAKALAKSSQLTIEIVVDILVEPYVRLIESQDWGFDATRFIARTLLEFTPEMKKAVELPARKSARNIANLLPHCALDVPKKLLLTRFNFASSAVIHGFAEYRSLGNSYFGNLEYRNLQDLATIYKSAAADALRAPVGQ